MPLSFHINNKKVILMFYKESKSLTFCNICGIVILSHLTRLLSSFFSSISPPLILLRFGNVQCCCCCCCFCGSTIVMKVKILHHAVHSFHNRDGYMGENENGVFFYDFLLKVYFQTIYFLQLRHSEWRS
jgi:hypothetical protein